MTTEETPLTMPIQGMQGNTSRSLMDVALFGIVAGGLLALHFNQTRIEHRLDTLERALSPKKRNTRQTNEQMDEYDEDDSDDDDNDHEKYDSTVQVQEEVHKQGSEEVKEDIREEEEEEEEDDDEEPPPPATMKKK
jgi:hypothetical protein